jgi:TolB-like protein/TPR repeat protein
MFCAALVLVGSSAAEARQPRKKKKKTARETVVAVFPFKVLNPDKRFAHFGEGAADAIITRVVKDGVLKIVEESQLDKAVNSLARNATGLFEEDSALDIGQMVDARFIVIGSVDMLGEQVAISARVLEVETRQLLVADRVHGPVANAFNLYDELGVRITKHMHRHLANRVAVRGGQDDADAAAVKDLLNKGKKFDPMFGGADLPRAISWYKKAVLRDPNSPTTRFALGNALARGGHHHEAKYNLEHAVELNGKHAPSYAWLGFVEDRMGNKTAARANYQSAIDRDPKFSEAHYFMAVFLNREGEAEAAFTHAKRAAKLGHKKAPALIGNIKERIAAQEEPDAHNR